jgi:hypothetical protein
MNFRPMKALAAACMFATVTGSVSAQQQSGKPAEQPPTSGHYGFVSSSLSGFNLVLVVGETQPSGSAGAEDLPPAARKALNDMREFLPYKHYRVLDVQWTSCCAPGSTTVITGRLQGVTGMPGPQGALTLVPRAYGFSIRTTASQNNLPIRFVLNPEEPGRARNSDTTDAARAAERERQDLQAEIMTLDLQIQKMRKQVEVGLTPANDLDLRRLVDQHASLRRRLADMDSDAVHTGSTVGRAIMDSSFTMDAGETVVVGTSRLGGDKALIAVVSAVRKGSGRRE